MDTLHLLKRSDLRKLLAARPMDLPGLVLRLNRSTRYHNQLDAIAISVEIIQRRDMKSARTHRQQTL